MISKSTLLACAGAVVLGATIWPCHEATAASTEAAAAPADEDALPEVIVTAQHRTENLQSAAVAVDSVSASQLIDANVTNLEEMSRLTPALTDRARRRPHESVFSARRRLQCDHLPDRSSDRRQLRR